MLWYQGDDDEEEELMCSPALLARRASESWIDTPPVEVRKLSFTDFDIKHVIYCPPIYESSPSKISI